MKSKAIKPGEIDMTREIKRYTCPSCGKLLTVHSDICPHCRQRCNRRDRR